ncbi:MAG: hypothetical protein ACREBG_13835 [Pyrinomonadaceae bacterium]
MDAGIQRNLQPVKLFTGTAGVPPASAPQARMLNIHSTQNDLQ